MGAERNVVSWLRCIALAGALCWVIAGPATSQAFGSPGSAKLDEAQSVWVRKPYVLVKSIPSDPKDERGPAVRLCHGREANCWDVRAWLCDGVLVTATLVSEVVGFAVTPNFIVLQLEQGKGYAVIESTNDPLEDPALSGLPDWEKGARIRAQVPTFGAPHEVINFLKRNDPGFTGPLMFESFDAAYKRSGHQGKPSELWPGLLCLSVVVIPPLAILWLVIRTIGEGRSSNRPSAKREGHSTRSQSECPPAYRPTISFLPPLSSFS